MKRIIMILVLILMSGMVKADLVINEVYYDPIEDENDGEFIELYNNGNESIDLSGTTITTQSSDPDATLPETTLAGKTHYLVADSGFSGGKDSEDWPEADHEESMTLTNDEGWIEIRKDGNITDSIGWGSPHLEGDAAPDADEGKSLQRINYTGNDSLDFTASTPNPRNSMNRDDSISLTVDVLDLDPSIKNISITDEDESRKGNQIIPLPGKEKMMDIGIIIEDNNTITEAYIEWKDNHSLNKTEDINETTSLYETHVPVEYFTEAKGYNLSISIKNDLNLTTDAKTGIEIMSMTAFEIDNKSISCTVAKGKSCLIEGDNNMDTKQPTIKNIGNTGFDLSLSAGNEGNMTIDYGFGEGMRELNTSSTINELGLNPANTVPFELSIDVPETTEEGTYNNEIIMEAVI
ncbi:MAG: lamin tail domain-containing protein [Nanobdellota archaeon]